MTADMPDAVNVAREAVFANADAIQRLVVNHTTAFTIALWGARAMQDAMAGRVRVKALEWIKPPLSETMRKCETPLGTYRTWTHHEADGQWFWSFEFGMMTEQGKGASEAEVQAAAQAHRSSLILSALEPAGGQEGAGDQPPYPEGDVVGPCVCGSWPGGPCLKCEWRPATPAPDVPGAAFWERAYNRRTGQAIEARARATAAEAERDALKAEVERLRIALGGAG